MTIHSRVLLVAASLGLALTAAQPAMAFSLPVTVKASRQLEDIACRIARSRIVLPGGRVIYRKVRSCAAPVVRPVPRCKVMRERIVRPNGTVIFRSVRRCG